MEISLCEATSPKLNDILRMFKVIFPTVNIEEIYNLNIGLKKYLVVDGNKFYIINTPTGDFHSVDVFQVDENDKINYVSFHNSNLMYQDDVAFTYYNDMTPVEDFDYYNSKIGKVTNSVTILETDEYGDSNYDAIIFNLSYNLDKAISMKRMFLYKTGYTGKNIIKSYHCTRPFYIGIDNLKTGKSKEFFLTEWNRDMKYYGLVLLKFVGIMDYIDERQMDRFEYYFDKPLFGNNEQLNFKNMLVSDMYDDECINKIIEENGFSVQIPQEIIDLYNGNSKEYLYCSKVLELYRNYNGSKLCKKLG